jgi:DNA-binding response OmpR family regulator
MSISDPTAFRFRIAFVEPDASQASHLGQLLEFEGFDVATFGLAGVVRLPPHGAHLVVLNHLALRDRTLSIARGLEAGTHHRPLTLALVGHSDHAAGIELVERGVDAYIFYPCGPREFVARVRAMLRRVSVGDQRRLDRAAGDLPNNAVRVSSLEIDPLRRRVQLEGQAPGSPSRSFSCYTFSPGIPGECSIVRRCSTRCGAATRSSRPEAWMRW